ncbi:hypothetical protein ACFSM5_11740 [Lacibacterium aquatile]|uniref:Cysteine dioxygenase n=1 Tax=Lacibacterium aquatile TaxID=1168082 RepID=A0ABW5DQX6_9PROT
MNMMISTLNPVLLGLIADVDAMVTADESCLERRIADRLKPILSTPGLLRGASIQFRQEDYTLNVLYSDPAGRWAIAAVAWLPGQKSSIHDHQTWCAFGVYEGEAVEEYFCATDGTATHCGQRALPTGATGFAGASCDNRQAAIHRLGNHGEQPLVSLHVYGCDLGRGASSVATKFDS